MKYSYLLVTSICLLSFLTANSQIITTFAGNGSPTFSGDGGPATAAGIQPHDVAIDNAGNIYVVDRPARIRKINTAGIISTYAGTGIAGYSGDGGAATAAQLSYSNSIMMDNKGNLFISDGLNNAIRKIDASGIITTIAGTGAGGYSGDGGPATAARFEDPYSVFPDTINGNIYIADGYNSAIRMIDTSGIITTIAGNGTSGYSGDGGPATAASLNYSTCVFVTTAGEIYFMDDNNNRLRKIDTSGIITTVAGNGTAGYTGDGGPATAAEINDPFNFTIDECGDIFISDIGNNVVRMVNPSGIISTFCGTGTAGYSGDGGPATAAEIYNNSGFVFDKQGYLYLADGTNLRVRRIDNVLPEPSAITGPTTVCETDSITLTDTVAGGVWSSSNTTIATVTSTGIVKGISGGVVTISYTVPSYTGCSVGGAVYNVTSLKGCKITTGILNTPATADEINVYPNPTNAGQFFVNLTTASEEKVEIVVTNIIGQVMNKTTGNSNSPISIMLDAPAGVYFITARTASNIWNKEIINR